MVVRQMWTLSLVFDHRLVDGAPAARFLQYIKQLIEEALPAHRWVAQPSKRPGCWRYAAWSFLPLRECCILLPHPAPPETGREEGVWRFFGPLGKKFHTSWFSPFLEG